MRIFVTGGGSAGHVTPILSVGVEIKRLAKDSEVVFIRQFGDDKTERLLAAQGADVIDRVIPIMAGKFRRYNGITWWRQLIDIPTQLKNARDVVYFLLGFIRSMVLMVTMRPDVVFVKGGYVGLPVGLAASLMGKPLVIHESDTHMGLTNKILSSRASAICLGVPKKYLNLEHDMRAHFVGIPVSSQYRKVTKKMQERYKQKLGIDPSEKLIVVTGGSGGAERVNNVMAAIANELVRHANVIHQTGVETFETTRKAIYGSLPRKMHDRYKMLAFIEKDMHVYFGAGDIIVSRVGTTTLSELAISAKPLILIPNPKLVYGHQLKNARMYEDAGAAIVLDEDSLINNPENLLFQIKELLLSKEKRDKLSRNLHRMSTPMAAENIAKLVIDTIVNKKEPANKDDV